MFYVSYFYQLRFFPQNLIPVSTAVWDPRWFSPAQYKDWLPPHERYPIFAGSHGVVYGVRCPALSPMGIEHGMECVVCDHNNSKTCLFLKSYYKHLESLDFESTVRRIEDNCKRIRKDADIALIVHEAPTNPCSERVMLQKWFKVHGRELPEWHPNS